MPNAMRTECAKCEWDEFGVVGELKLEPELRGNKGEVDDEEDEVGKPGMSGGKGGWEEANAVWIVEGCSGEPARLRTGETISLEVRERLGGGGKLNGGLEKVSPDIIGSVAEPS